MGCLDVSLREVFKRSEDVWGGGGELGGEVGELDEDEDDVVLAGNKRSGSNGKGGDDIIMVSSIRMLFDLLDKYPPPVESRLHPDDEGD